MIEMNKTKLSDMMGKHKLKKFSDLERQTGISRKTLAKIYNSEGGGIDYDTLNALPSSTARYAIYLSLSRINQPNEDYRSLRLP